MSQETAAGVTHVVHWIPPDLIRTRKWFGRGLDGGYWELQTRDAYEAGSAKLIVLDGPDTRDAPPAVLAEAVSEELGCPVLLEECEAENGKGAYRIPGLHCEPVRWLDAPVYDVRPVRP
jgi:hypothetical protein